jgi:peptide/nickel transport system substrate-binding protein
MKRRDVYGCMIEICDGVLRNLRKGGSKLKRILFISLAVILALGVGLIGCEGEEGEGEGECEAPVSVLENAQGFPSDPDACPVYGGTLIILHDSAPSNIGAFYMSAGGWDSPQSRPALEKLCGLGTEGQVVPQLATAWVLNESAMTITFTLREGVEFHDATPFNAAAVEYNVELFRDYGQQHALDDMIDAVPNGDYEIELQFSTWDPNMIRNFMGSAGIMISPTHHQAVGDDAQWEPVGTGPFKFVNYQDDVELIYEKNDDYWQEGLPYLDGIEIHYVSDDVTRILAFENEDGHVLNQFSTGYALSLAASGYEVLSRVVHIKGIVPDSKSGPFVEQDLREVLAYAFDRANEVQDIFDNQWEPTGQAALYGRNGYNSSIVGYPYSVATARGLMEAHGYNATNRLACDLWYSTSECTGFYTVLKDYLEDVYIDITLKFLSRGPYMGKSGGGWDGLLEWQFSYNGFELLYDQSLQMGMSPDATRNVDVAYPAAYEALYDAMLLEDDPATREEMYQTLNAMVIDTYCLVMPHFAYEVFSARQPYVHDWGYGVIASEYCPEYAWMDP